jgi:hypothetical protein
MFTARDEKENVFTNWSASCVDPTNSMHLNMCTRVQNMGSLCTFAETRTSMSALFADNCTSATTPQQCCYSCTRHAPHTHHDYGVDL